MRAFFVQTHCGRPFVCILHAQADLVSRLTLEEKVGLMSADTHTHVDACNMMDHGVPRLGIPPYMNLVETK